MVIIEPDVFGDDRGYFFESYNQARFDAAVRPVRSSGGEQNAADDRPARRPDAEKPAPAPRPLPADSPASLPTRADLPASLPASAQEEPVRLDDPGIVPSRALKQGDSADGRLSE